MKSSNEEHHGALTWLFLGEDGPSRILTKFHFQQKI